MANLVNNLLTLALEPLGLTTYKRAGFMDVNNGVSLVVAVVLLVVYIVLVLLIGKWLFNNVFCALFTCGKHATSAWQILGLMILFNLLFP